MMEHAEEREEARCAVHDEPLLDGHAAVFDALCVEPSNESSFYERISKLHFPHANTDVWGMGLPDPYPVRFCPKCRQAKLAWSAAPADWRLKAWWMTQGFDPYRGNPARPFQATLAPEYPFIEKYARMVDFTGSFAYFLPRGAAATLDEYVLREAARARAEGAPIWAAVRGERGWITVDQIGDWRLKSFILELA
jgi:hypothetical protein